MADWVTISSLATAGGTLVLAVATFSSVRSANRSARVAERTLLAGLRPVLIPSHEDDPAETLRFGDQVVLTITGHGGAVLRTYEVIYLALGLRNGGNGLAVIHGWHVHTRPTGVTGRAGERPDLADFTRQNLDIFIPAGEVGYWLGAIRDPSSPAFERIRQGAANGEMLEVDLLYGDHEGGQRAIARFSLQHWAEDGHVGKRAIVTRYWNVDGDDPRSDEL